MYDTRPQFDDRDAAILALRVIKWRARKGPRVGDYIILADGDTRRFTYEWPDHGIQTTCPNYGYGASFYFDRWGHCDFSGGLDQSIPHAQIVDTGQELDGSVWFFHHDQSGAHRGVHAVIPCRVYRRQS